MKKTVAGGLSYMKLEGHAFPRRPGRASKHMGWYPVSSVSFNPSPAQASPSTGLSAAHYVDHAVEVTRQVDAGTPALQEICLAGKAIPHVEFDLYRTVARTQILTYHISLEDCTIQDIKISGALRGMPATCSFRVSFAGIVKLESFE